MESKKVNILIFTPYYLPGYKAGGPIRSLTNLVDSLGDNFQFRIITSDREFRSVELYKGVIADEWNSMGKADVFYCSPKNQNLHFYKKLIKETPHDIIYLNSFFEFRFTILPLLLYKFNFIDNSKMILAPRGELSPGALNIKKIKKKLFIIFSVITGLYDNIIWHASNNYEETHIRNIFGKSANVRKAINISSVPSGIPKKGIRKRAGKIKIIFLSRISNKKNLDGALKILKDIKGEVIFDIYGPIEDRNYWIRCEKLISGLQENVQAVYKGIIPYSNVQKVISNYHLFFLPTKAENYGHVIFEALSVGCPVLISDQTPWKNIEINGAGFICSLDNDKKFITDINKILNMDEASYRMLSIKVMEYANDIMSSDESIEKNRELFDKMYK